MKTCRRMKETESWRVKEKDGRRHEETWRGIIKIERGEKNKIIRRLKRAWGKAFSWKSHLRKRRIRKVFKQWSLCKALT